LFRRKSAFTLIELLVVIAIIAILAAILFPVFAQAKAAAKTSVGVSNIKQITLGAIMYGGDFDDNRVERVIQDFTPGGPVTDEHSWKELIAPYVKNTAMYSDPQNKANKVPDIHSDALSRAAFGWTPAVLPANLQFPVSYHLTNVQIGAPGNFANQNTAVSMTSFQSPATTGFFTESHVADADTGPYIGWGLISGETGNLSALNGLVNNGGDGYGYKAATAGYMDGHAKRTSYSVMDCTAYNTNKTNPTDTTPDFWNISAADLVPNGWESNCQSLRAMPAPYN